MRESDAKCPYCKDPAPIQRYEFEECEIEAGHYVQMVVCYKCRKVVGVLDKHHIDDALLELRKGIGAIADELGITIDPFK